jgi:Uma2 family endonuclease
MPTMSAAGDALEREPTRPLLRREYDQLVELGAFEDEKIELIDGRLVHMSPEGAPHAKTISFLNHLLVIALNGRARIRVGSPLAVSEVSEPEPDLAAVAIEDDRLDHPETAYLAIEVSSSSLRKDSVVKPRLYGGAAVPEYWIVDLKDRCVVVLTEPTADGFARSERRGPGESIPLVAFPDVTFAVDDFLR